MTQVVLGNVVLTVVGAAFGAGLVIATVAWWLRAEIRALFPRTPQDKEKD